MLAKFKMSLVEGPAAIEKRKQRQAIAAARAARAAQREEARLRQERDRAKQAELAAQAAADAERAVAEQAARDAAEQAERNALLEAEQKAARDARYAARKAAKKNGGEATSPKPGASPPISLSCRTCGKGRSISGPPAGHTLVAIAASDFQLCGHQFATSSLPSCSETSSAARPRVAMRPVPMATRRISVR